MCTTCHSGVRVGGTAFSNRASCQQLPAGNRLYLTIDDIPADAAKHTLKLIRALAPTDNR